MSVREERRRTRRLILCLLVAAAVRLLALHEFSGVVALHGDENEFQKVATQILEGRGYPGSVRPPAYPAFIVGVYAVFGPSRLALRLAQIAVSLVAVLAVFRISAARFGTRAATFSALTCALAPALVHYTHFLWAECLATTLLMLAFWALDGYERTARTDLAALAGAVLGLCALARETWVLFGLLLGLWIVWRQRPRWRAALAPAAAFVGGLLLVVAPWTVRNYSVHDSFVLVSTGRWYPMAHGNLLGEDWLLGGVRMKAHRDAVHHLGELEQERYYRELALGAIRAQQPWWIFKKVVRNSALFVSVQSQCVRFFRRGWIELPQWRAATLIATSVVGHLLLVGLGIAALWLVPGGWLKQVVVFALLYTLGVHIVAVSGTRYLVPLMPLLAIYVGPLLARRELILSRRRLAGVTLTLALFGVLLMLRWSHDLSGALAVVAAGS